MIHRLIMAIFTTLPALLWTVLLFVLVSPREYFYATYQVVMVVFGVVSFGLGFLLARGVGDGLLSKPWVRVSLLGAVAWAVALMLLAALNFTPLCVGQNNGDGHNTVAMCGLQTAGVALVYTPVELGLLVFSAMGARLALTARRPPARVVS